MHEGLQLILTALGNALLNSFWQMGLLLLLVLIYTKTHKKLSPSKLSFISFIALVTGFIAFVSTFVISIYTPTISTSIFGKIINIDFLQTLITYAAVVYIVLLVIPIVKLSKGFLHIYHLKKTGIEKVPGHLKLFVLDMCQYLNLKRKVKVFTSIIVQSPLTIGFLKPVILLPIAMLSQLSVQQVETVILHELAHIKRNDYVLNIILQVILTLMYFNPFAKMIVDLQHTEREKSADKWVVQFEYNQHMYANTLLQIARQNIAVNNILAVNVYNKNTPLLERIEWLFGSQKRKHLTIKSILLLLSIVLGMFVLAFLKTPESNITTAADKIAFAPIPATYIEESRPTSSIHDNAEGNAPSISENNNVKIKEKKQPIEITDKRETKSTTTDNSLSSDEPEHTIRFVSNATVVIPQLPKEDENNLQQAVEVTKKVATELSWKTIENALAETVTSKEKEVLKDLYAKKIASVDWGKQADQLRLNYNNIDWKNVNDKFTIVLNAIRADSIYHACQDVTETLKIYRKELVKDPIANKIELDFINKKILLFNNAVKKIDSLRSKKIVEL